MVIFQFATSKSSNKKRRYSARAASRPQRLKALFKASKKPPNCRWPSLMSGSYVCYSYWSTERFGKAEPCIARTHEIIRFLHLQTTDLELRLTQDVASLFGPVFKATQRHKMFCWWFVNVIITDRMNNDENEKAVKPPTNKSCRVLLDLEVEMIHVHRFTPWFSEPHSDWQ